MKKALSLIYASLAFFCCQNQPVSGSDVGAYYGTVAITVGDGSSSVASPSYKVVSAGLAGEPIYTGIITSATSNTISFEVDSSSDSDGNSENPFVSGVYGSGVKVPVLTPVMSGSSPNKAVNTITVTYGGSGFSAGNPPKIIVDYPDLDDNQSIATATINGSGVVNAVTVDNGGAGYSGDPKVSVVAGPHFVRLIQEGSSDIGRTFLITDNNATRLTLDTSRLASGETIPNILQVNYSVEIIPANTLGGLMGTTADKCPLNDGYPTTADLIYLWDTTLWKSYFFFTGNSSFDAGWSQIGNSGAGLQNDKVLYPDEGVIVARRTGSEAEIEVVGSVSEVNQKMRLPATGQQTVMNNPFGTDVLLGEIIPCGYLGTGAGQFRPSASDGNYTLADTIFFLSGSTWTQYYYKGNVNDGVTAVASATAKTPTGGTMSSADVSLDAGTVTALASCDKDGNSVDHNVSEYTKVSLSGTAPLDGFTITFSEVSGQKINDNGDDELDVNGTDVGISGLSAVTAYSSLNGSHEIEERSGTWVVVKGRRDVNFDSAKGSKTWSTGSAGTGYNTTAKAYFIGGGGSGAVADVNLAVSPPTFTFTGSGNSVGTNYTSAPQVVITGGGWRITTGSSAPQDGATLDADEGLILIRKNPSGVLTYIEAINPNKK